MPERHKRKDSQEIGDASNSPAFPTAEWDVDVPHDPAVKAAMPSSPESLCGVVIAHTSDHILWRIDAIDECP